MISNPSLIRDNILKSTLNEQIIKVTKVINCAPAVCDRINRLTEELAIQQNMLVQLRDKFVLRQEHLARTKEGLKRELKAKMFLKITQQEALSGQMKILQQNCHFIREKKHQLSEIKAKGSRLTNQLEELDIHEKQAEQNIQKLQLQQIYDKKIQTREEETVKQLLMLIEAKKNKISKESRLLDIVHDEINEKQAKIRALKDQSYEIQVSIAKTLPSLEALNKDTSKLQVQVSRLNQKITTLTSQNNQLTLKTSQNSMMLGENTQKVTQITQTISTLIEQSNQLNEKIIKSHEHVIHVNAVKNNQKKLNQQLKLKVRELMKIVIQNQQNPK